MIISTKRQNINQFDNAETHSELIRQISTSS